MAYPTELALENGLQAVAQLLLADPTLVNAREAFESFQRVLGHIRGPITADNPYTDVTFTDADSDPQWAAPASLPLEADVETGLDDIATALLENRTLPNAESRWNDFQSMLSFIRDQAWPTAGFGAEGTTAALVNADFGDV